MTPKFHNVANSRITVDYITPDGSKHIDHWISRSVAVVGVVVAVTDDGLQILITKRSKHMMDEKQKMCVPCGYLDWQESGFEAVTREIYEETSLYLPDYKDLLMYNNNEQPFKIKDKPFQDKKENVSFLYLSIYNFSNCMDKFPKEIENYTCRETELVRWIKLVDFYLTYQEMQWAFHHEEAIKDAMVFMNKNFDNFYNL